MRAEEWRLLAWVLGLGALAVVLSGVLVLTDHFVVSRADLGLAPGQAAPLLAPFAALTFSLAGGAWWSFRRARTLPA